MEKLKAQVVARGHLQYRDEFTDNWSSCVSMNGLRMFLAMAAKLEKRVKQLTSLVPTCRQRLQADSSSDYLRSTS
eukprot:4840020-Ditylum_brightwellii.AAC.1